MSRDTDPVAVYFATFKRLRAGKRWTTNTATFRFVALALGAAGADVTYDRLDRVAAALRKRARWTSPLKSEIRYVVAAMILRRGLDPARIHARVFETRDAFKAHKIASRGTGPTLAALLLALQAEGRQVPRRTLVRLARIYRRWRADHFWLTDANDLPAAALHAGRDKSVEALAVDVERAYTGLRGTGFSRGNMLQLVSHLLAVDPRGTDAAVQRYDEIAMLALSQAPPARVVDRVLRYRDRLREAKPRPSRDVAFSLAAGITLADDTERAGKRGAGDLAALRSIQAILDAQQAVMVSAIAASTAASSAASG